MNTVIQESGLRSTLLLVNMCFEVSMSKITDIVSQLAVPIVEEEGCSLWDVEFIKEAGTWYLRVFIDKEGGVSIDDCERISRRLDPILDEKDPITDSYVFEVGSAGADRILKRDSDYLRYIGTKVDIKLYKPVNGVKAYTGTLTGISEENITICVNDDVISLKRDCVAQTRLHVDFN